MFLEKPFKLNWKDSFIFYRITDFFNHEKVCYHFCIRKPVDSIFFQLCLYNVIGEGGVIYIGRTDQECYDYADLHCKDVLCL